MILAIFLSLNLWADDFQRLSECRDRVRIQESQNWAELEGNQNLQNQYVENICQRELRAPVPVANPLRRKELYEPAEISDGNTCEACQNARLDELAECQKKCTTPTEKVVERGGEQTPVTEPAPSQPVNYDYDQTQSLLLECKASQMRAQDCCTNPVKCMSPGSNVDAADMQIISALVVGGTALTATGEGMSQMCGAAKNINIASAAANGAMGSACIVKKNQCSRACSAIKMQISAKMQACQANRNCSSQDYSLFAQVQSAQNQCDSYSLNAAQMLGQTTQNLIAMKMADLCQKQAKVNTTGFDEFDPKAVFNGNCSDPANASNPLCQGYCNRAGAQNDPLCKANSAKDSNGSNQGSKLSSFGDRATPNVGMGDNNLEQGSNPPSLSIQARRANAVNGNSGGFAPGSAQGSGFGSNTGQSGGGFKTDIDKGLGGGTGYSVSNGSGYSSPSGFSGYGSNNVDSNGQPFDLKQFLPSDNSGRKPAAVTSTGTHPELGSRYDDIFNRVSRRYFQLCLQDRLLDCDKMNMKSWKRHLMGFNQ